MAKDLRKTLSKNRVKQQKPVEIEKIENDTNLTNAYKASNDIDPLNFFEKPSTDNQVNPLKFLDLISSSNQEKRERENEFEKEREFKEHTGFKDIEPINKNRLTMVQSSRMKTENRPMKLIDPQDAQRDEQILKRFHKEEKAQESKVIPGKLDKLNSIELDQNQKQHIMERMSSARQNMSKIAFGKVLLKKTDAIMERARQLEEKIQPNVLNQGTQPNDKEHPSFSHVIKDADVQIVNETTGNTNNQFRPVKDVDIDSFMKPKADEHQTGPKKETRSIADIILKRPAQAGKKKGTTPVFDPEKK